MRITFDADLLSSPYVGSLKSDNEIDDIQSGDKISLDKAEGSYFGEWMLLGESMGSLNAVAVGDCICSVLIKEKFDSVAGPLAKLAQDDEKYVSIPS